MMEVVLTTGAISRAKLQSNRHHQQTNTRLFTAWMPFLSPNQQCQSTEGKKYNGERETKEQPANQGPLLNVVYLCCVCVCTCIMY